MPRLDTTMTESHPVEKTQGASDHPDYEDVPELEKYAVIYFQYK